MDDAQIQEAAEAVLQSAGISAYLYGIGYSLEQFLQELDAAVEYLKSQGGQDKPCPQEVAPSRRLAWIFVAPAVSTYPRMNGQN